MTRSETNVTINKNPINIGQSQTIGCAVNDAVDQVTPTGTVSVNDNNAGGTFTNNPCTLAAVPHQPGAASCSVTYKAPSSGKQVTLTATYSGDGTFSASSASGVLTVIGKIINLFRRLHP